MQPKQIQLHYVTPTVSQDGSTIFITDGNDVPTINFFQARREDNTNVYVDVVASIRFTTIDELQRLHDQIAETIKQHQNREK